MKLNLELMHMLNVKNLLIFIFMVYIRLLDLFNLMTFYYQ